MKKILLGLVMLCMFAGSAFATQTVTILKRESWGSSRVVYGYIAFTTESYVTGGITVTPRSVGLDNVNQMVISDMSSPTYGWMYLYATNKVYLQYAETNPYEPAGTPLTDDYFTVVDDNSAADDKLLVICATGGGATGGYFGYMDATGVAGSATIAYSRFSAADAITTVGVVDSVRGMFYERAVLVHADTVFFDDDATNSYDRLMYSGAGLGDMGDIYVPFQDGNCIKISKKTRSQIEQAAALPLYYDEDATINLKLLSVTNGNANSTFSVDPTYSSLTLYNPIGSEEIPNGTSVSATVRFIAIGN